MAFHVQNVKKVKNKDKDRLDFNVTIASSIPFLLVLFILVLLPFAFIFMYAFMDSSSASGYLKLTFDNFDMFASPVFLRAIGLSMLFALISTAICLVLGYPIAYYLGRVEAKVRNLLVMLITVPMWINMLLRILAWKQIFNMITAWTGIQIVGTDFAVIFGMVYDLVPFMIIPIYTSILKIDPQLYEASKDLGANGKQTFFKVTIPLSMPGVISGITMVFLPAATTLVIPSILGEGAGNSRYYLIGAIIENAFIKQSDPYTGSAIALILSLLILGMIFFVNKLDRSIVKDNEGRRNYARIKGGDLNGKQI